jgi:membrane protein DedA with SNARE-associated domain
VLAALAGALLGDQAGYQAGRWGGAPLLDRVGQKVALVAKARNHLGRRGDMAVLLSRWLLSEIGPFVNLAAGASGLPWARFTLWSVLGEAIWVGLYIGVGRVATGSLEAASGLVLRIIGLLGVGAVPVGLGAWLLSTLRAERKTAL